MTLRPRQDPKSRFFSRYGARMAQWRVELSTQDIVALSDAHEITVTAFDEEQDSSSAEILEVTITLLDV